MAKFSLAARLADELGTSVDEAAQFIDDIGEQQARQTVVNVGDEGAAGTGISNWWKAAGAGGALGAGALAWRQQDVQRAEAIAQRQQSYSKAMRSIISSDLPGDLKSEMARDANNAATGGGGGGSGGGGGPLDALGGLMGDAQTTLALLVVLVILVTVAGGDE